MHESAGAGSYSYGEPYKNMYTNMMSFPIPGAAAAKRSVASDPLERIERMAAAKAVVIFSNSTCCMCHAAKRLFCSMGVNPTVYEIDLQLQDPNGGIANGLDLHNALLRLATALPVVFVGGKLVGGIDSLMASHITGSLVPLLKHAGALWL